MAANIYGVDIGTADIKVIAKATDQVFTEKDAIAIKNKKEFYAYGDEAYAMYEKTPSSISVSFPVVNGVIADFNNMQRMIEDMFEKNMKGHLKNAEFIIAVPTDITEVEKRSFYELFYKSKMRPKTVRLCEKPIAAAIGRGLDVKESTGLLIVDLGADTTEVSVLSLSGLVYSDLVRVGGNHMDDAIIAHIKRKYSLVIGHKTAQQLKMELGSGIGADYGTRVIVGRDVVSGLPIEMEISSKDVNEAISEQLNNICTSVKMILEKTPPELAKDIIYSGIYAVGGTSNLHDIDKMITQATNIKVNLTENAEECAVRGLVNIVAEKKFNSLLYNMKN